MEGDGARRCDCTEQSSIITIRDAAAAHSPCGGWREAGHPWEQKSAFPLAAVPLLCPRNLQKESERFPGRGLEGGTGRRRRMGRGGGAAWGSNY